MKKHYLSIFFIFIFLCNFSIYALQNHPIVIIYETNAHQNIENYSTLSALKKELLQANNYVALVSVGNFISEKSAFSSASNNTINLMNYIGYDAIALGEKDFNYDIFTLLEHVDLLNTSPVCCNFQKVDQTESFFLPYNIVDYGNTKVAYIGVTTPNSTNTTYSNQSPNNKNEYNSYTFNTKNLYTIIQNSVDQAKKENANYVVLLTHLGTENIFEQTSCQNIAQNTTNIDAILDGHSSKAIKKLIIKNKNNIDVIITSTGSNFNNIGKLTLNNGSIKTELINTKNYTQKDTTIQNFLSKNSKKNQSSPQKTLIKTKKSFGGFNKLGITKKDLVTYSVLIILFLLILIAVVVSKKISK